MLPSESKSKEPNKPRLDETKKIQEDLKPNKGAFTGWILQALMLFLGSGCFLTGSVIATHQHKLQMVTHVLHPFYWQFRAASIFYIGTGIVAFGWCLLDYFLLNPRHEERKKWEKEMRSLRSKKLTIITEETPTSIRCRVYRGQRRKGDSDTRSKLPTGSATNRRGLRRVNRRPQDNEDSDEPRTVTLGEYEKTMYKHLVNDIKLKVKV